MSIHKKFSSILYQYRTQRHYTQRYMAELCGVSLRHYQDLELGHSVPSLTTAIRIASVLDFSLDLLKSEVNADEGPVQNL